MKRFLGASFLSLLSIGAILHLQAQPLGIKTGEIAAYVNSEPIKMSEVQAILDTKLPTDPVPKSYLDESKKAVLDLLIDDVLMRQYLRQNVKPPAASEVQKDIDKLQDALKLKGISLDQFLREGKQTIEQLRADIASRQQWKSYLISLYPEETLHGYYLANKLFFDKAMVRASHILKKVNGNASVQEKQAAIQSLELIRQEILTEKKISFENAAKKYSDCPSKEKFGDIGEFPYKFVVVKQFAEAAFNLNEGEISKVVESEFGYHLIKVTKRTPGEPSKFEEIKDSIREVKAQDADLYHKILAKQHQEAKIERFIR